MQTQPRYWKEDARSTAAVLRAEVKPGDLVFMIGGWDPIARYYWTALRDDPALRHYFPPYRVSPEQSPSDAAKALAEIRSANRTYVVFCRDDFEDPDGRWEAFLRETVRDREDLGVPGFQDLEARRGARVMSAGRLKVTFYSDAAFYGGAEVYLSLLGPPSRSEPLLALGDAARRPAGRAPGGGARIVRRRDPAPPAARVPLVGRVRGSPGGSARPGRRHPPREFAEHLRRRALFRGRGGPDGGVSARRRDRAPPDDPAPLSPVPDQVRDERGDRSLPRSRGGVPPFPRAAPQDSLGEDACRCRLAWIRRPIRRPGSRMPCAPRPRRRADRPASGS